jgi:hypothetical protein
MKDHGSSLVEALSQWMIVEPKPRNDGRIAPGHVNTHHTMYLEAGNPKT